MSVKLTLGLDVGKLSSGLAALPGQLSFAESLALNRTAYIVQQAEKADINKVFDAPTKFTQNAVLYKKSEKSQKEKFVIIYIRDEAQKGTPPVKYLWANIVGGERSAKRFEKNIEANTELMQATGRRRIIPSDNMQLDANGNVPKGVITKMLSDIKAFSESGAAMNRKKNGRRSRRDSYFLIRSKRYEAGISPAIMRRKGDDVEVAFIAIKKAEYKKVFDFYGVLEKTWDENIEREYAQAIQEAVSKTFR